MPISRAVFEYLRNYLVDDYVISLRMIILNTPIDVN